LIEIRVVGDSSSSGVGVATACYPYLLSESPRLRSQGDLRVVNFSVPGLTSADAAQLCLSSAFTGQYQYLLIYLGNNEGACVTRKGVAGWWPGLLRRARKRRRPALRPPRSASEPLAFQRAVQPVRPNAPHEFSRNLGIMIRSARRAGASVVLVNPIANRRFPSGLHASNGVFFKYVGLEEATGRMLRGTDPESEALVAAICLQEAGRTLQASATYERLAHSAGGLVAFVAKHNGILCLPDACAAIEALRALDGEFPCYDSVVLYNLHRLCLRAGQDADSARYLEASLERDVSSYRVTRAYREVILDVARENGIPLIDLAELLQPRHFVDYCHPTADGHRRIADALEPLLGSGAHARTTSGRHSYENRFVSPNSFFEDADLVTYYQIEREVPDAHILAALAPLISRDGRARSREGDPLTHHLAQFLHSNDAHAAFAPELDLLGPQAPRAHEVFSFPEFYLYRLLRSYGAAFEAQELAARMDAEGACARLLVRPSGYDSLILRHGRTSLEMDLHLGLDYLRSIEARLAAARKGPAFTSMIGDRIKTVSVWYTREAFRYGTLSRLSMLYDRWEVERLAEAIAVAAVIAAHNHLQERLTRYGKLLRELDGLDSVHMEHAALYHGDPARFSTAEYERELGLVADRVSSLLRQG
jgi:hypothetical protein